MGVTLKRQEAIYRRVFVYTVTDVLDAVRTGDHMIIPEAVRIELDRDSEHEPWRITFVTIYGVRRLKGGGAGTRTAAHPYSGVADPEMPIWARDLAHEVLATTERERLNTSKRGCIDPECVPSGRYVLCDTHGM